MAEYINREEMLKYLEENNTADEWIVGQHNVDWIYSFIDSQPKADVEKVIRCKECKRCYEKRTKRNNQLMRFCMRIDGNEYQVNANDFCSYGTPKERAGEK